MSSMRRRKVMSIVEEQGVHSSSCGYCKSASSISVAQRLWAHKLTVVDYQELLNRGWRRSGMVLYKNNMHQSCCPPLSIRLNVNAFRISKDQARALRRMQRYLEGGSQLNGNSSSNKELDGEGTRKKGIGHDAPEFDSPTTAKKKRTSDEAAVQLTASLKDAITRCVEAGALPRDLDVPQVTVQRASQQVRDKMKLAELEYTSSVAFAIAAALRRRPTTEEANRLSSKEDLSSSLVAETLVSQLRETDRYIPQACNGHLNFLTAGCSSAAEGAPREKEPQERALIRPPTLPPPPCLKPRLMSTQIKRSEFDHEEYALYRKYQIAVHNDEPEDVGEGTYRRFLVDSPLIYVAPQENDGSVPSCGYGTFHQQYRIDGKLVAVGVLDVLPRCLSSYYFFWDPDLASLSLGKFSALREIGWVQETNKVCPALSYYYLGNYIHTCSKMRYKAAYAPSELLCPSTYIWVPYEHALPDLESAQYTCLFHSSSEPEKKGDEAENDVEMNIHEIKTENGPEPGFEKDENRLDQVVLLVDKKCLTFERLKELIRISAGDMEILTKELTLYVEGVGQDLASRMVFVSSL